MLTLEQTRALAPDEATLIRAQQLAVPRLWVVAERNDRALWGLYGKSSTPYQTVVDLNGPAYKCSCPVKRLPCKHALALLLMAADNAPNNFGQNNPPDWVQTWLEQRDRKQAAKNATKSAEQIARSEAAKAKNWDERLNLMQAGVEDLQRRLLDIIRMGMASLSVPPPQYWDDFAARMVDAKLGGLSRRIKSLAGLPMQYPDDWHERLLVELGSLYLWTKAFKKFEKLPPDLQEDIMTMGGVTQKKEELMTLKGLTDDWLVVGQVTEPEDDNLTSRRVWLTGHKSQRTVLVLDFAFGKQGFSAAWVSGQVYRAEVFDYPSAFPLRVAVRSFEPTNQPFSTIHAFQNWDAFLKKYSIALSLNPWITLIPALVSDIIPVIEDGNLFLVDKNKAKIKAQLIDNKTNRYNNWTVMAVSGGHPISIFGEWNGEVLHVMSLLAEGRLVGLT